MNREMQEPELVTAVTPKLKVGENCLNGGFQRNTSKLLCRYAIIATPNEIEKW
jgi:hypothetical protein